VTFTQPVVPFDLLPKSFPDDFELECKKLWEEVVEEMTDEDYYWQAHYKKSTFESGCRGPVCSKYIRDASRSRPRSTGLHRFREVRIYDPIIDFYKIVALKRVSELKWEQELKLREERKKAKAGR
jgi:hypothetical protein